MQYTTTTTEELTMSNGNEEPTMIDALRTRLAEAERKLAIVVGHNRAMRLEELCAALRSEIERREGDGHSIDWERAEREADATPSVEDAGQGAEDYPAYLRRVGADYRESGSEATAEDYDEAADRLQAGADSLRALRIYVGGPGIISQGDLQRRLERIAVGLIDR